MTLPSHSKASALSAAGLFFLLGGASSCGSSTQRPAEPPPAAPQASAGSSHATLKPLSQDAELLLRPTTGAVRSGSAWVAIGQLSSLFGTDPPKLPFRAISLSLTESGPSQQTQQEILLPGGDFYPEGITASRDGTLYIGSIQRGEVVRVPAGSLVAEPFVSSATTERGVIGMTVDEDRQLLWLCDSNPKLPEAEKGGALVGVGLTDGQEVARHPLPAKGETPAFCNDVIVDPDGNLWITETMGGRLFRVPANEALSGSAPHPFVDGGALAPPPDGCCGANGIEWVNHRIIVANSGRGTLVAIDPTATDPKASAFDIPVADEQGKPVQLCSPDGLAKVADATPPQLVLVENGGCDSQVPRVGIVTLPALQP